MHALKKVAVADDDPIYLKAFKNLLNAWQIKNEFTFFENGQKVLDFIRIKEAPELPDILLLDLNMPVMNGWQFLENYAALEPRLTKKIDLYVVSSSIWEEDEKRAAKNHFIKQLIIKPLSKNKILEILG